MSNLINTVYGGRLALKKTILVDFFRFGFDGSGADNFYDAGWFFLIDILNLNCILTLYHKNITLL